MATRAVWFSRSLRVAVQSQIGIGRTGRNARTLYAQCGMLSVINNRVGGKRWKRCWKRAHARSALTTGSNFGRTIRSGSRSGGEKTNEKGEECIQMNDGSVQRRCVCMYEYMHVTSGEIPVRGRLGRKSLYGSKVVSLPAYVSRGGIEDGTEVFTSNDGSNAARRGRVDGGRSATDRTSETTCIMKNCAISQSARSCEHAGGVSRRDENQWYRHFSAML